MALTKISTAMISQSAAAVDLNVDAGTFYVDTTNNRVGVGGKTDPDTPLHVIGTATATLFAGSGASLTSIPNSALVNSSITINSTAVSLGGSLTLTTANIAENTNLYYTNARADARIAAADTDDLSEGSSNLYYTDARVDARVSGGSLGNITTTGYIRGPATFTIDPAAHGDNTGTVVIAGNLQVDGTQTVINSTTLTVDDKNITLASGSANAAAASGAGFTVDIGTGTNPAITYDGTNDEWDFNKPLNVTGNIVVSGTVDGVDIAARDGVLTSTTTTAGAALPKAGGTTTGDLGVGATPTARLDVRRGDADGKIAEFHQNAGYGIDIGSSQSVAYISSGYNQRLDFKTDPTTGQTERMSILANGNVGIGTTDPSRNQYGSIDPKLHVNTAGTSGAYDLVARFQAGPDANNSGAAILINHTNDRGLLIEAGREISDTGIAHFGILNSGATKERILTLKQGGNVGIGVIDPDSKLEIKGAGGALGLTFKTTDASANETFYIMDGGRVGVRYYPLTVGIPSGTTPATNAVFQVEEAGLLTVLSTGKVGIGTTTPNSPLAISNLDNGTSFSSNRVLQLIGTSTTDGSRVSLAFSGNTSVGNGLAIIEAVNDDQSAGHTSLHMHTYNGSWNTENLVLKGGKVGIGTSDPQALLELSKTTAGLITGGTGNTGPVLRLHHEAQWENGYTGGDFLGAIDFSTGDASAGEGVKSSIRGTVDNYYNTSSLAFFTTASSGSTTLTERLRIENGGEIGIGTSNPAYKLDVGHTGSGAIQARFKSSGDTGYTQGAISLESGTTDSPGGRGQGVYMFNEGTDRTWYAGTQYGGTAGQYGISTVAGATMQTSAASNSNLALVINSNKQVGIGTNSPNVSTHTKLEVHGAIAAGSTQGTGGSLVLYQRYGVNDMPATLSTHYSNSYWLLATGMKARSGAAGYVSSLGNYSTARAGIDVNNSTINFLYVPAATVAVDTVLSPRSPFYMNLDTGEMQFRTTTNSLRGYISAQETNTNGTHTAGLVVATSGGESITFKDGGTAGTTNMVIDGAGRVGLPVQSSQLIVGAASDTNSLYGTTSVSAVGIFGEGAYAGCGAHMEIAGDGDIGWSPIYINKYDWQSGDDARWIAFGVNGFGTDSGTISYDGTNFGFTNGSDYRLKENIVDYSGGLAKIEELQVRSYNKKEGVSRDITQQGFIAHEAALANIPGLVLGEKDAMKEDEMGNTVPDYQSINREALIPYLVSAIQELTARVRELES